LKLGIEALRKTGFHASPLAAGIVCMVAIVVA